MLKQRYSFYSLELQFCRILSKFNNINYLCTGLVSSSPCHHALLHGLQLRVDVLRGLTFAHSTCSGEILLSADYKLTQGK